MPHLIFSKYLAQWSQFFDVILSNPARSYHNNSLLSDLNEVLNMWHKRV